MLFWFRIPTAVFLGLMIAASASTGLAGPSKDDVFSACEAQMQQQFGAAEFSFNKYRRNKKRRYAYGEMTLQDGSKKQIRCLFRRGQVRTLKFRTGSDSPIDGKFWTEERPAGAVYVPPAEPEADADTAGTSDTPEDTGADETAATPEETSGETTETAAVPTDPSNPQAPSEDAEAPASPETSETSETQAEDTETPTEEEVDPTRPVFKRVN